MSLQPGTRFGNYEVLSELGSGGMGEVYKARDLKLGREVAIILPQEMASDSQRLRRFEQEARAASALNHPNIVTIYEIGEHEGTPYIAMEYVEGKTLREMLADGPLPNDKLIRPSVACSVSASENQPYSFLRGDRHRRPHSSFMTAIPQRDSVHCDGVCGRCHAAGDARGRSAP